MHNYDLNVILDPNLNETQLGTRERRHHRAD